MMLNDKLFLLYSNLPTAPECIAMLCKKANKITEATGHLPVCRPPASKKRTGRHGRLVMMETELPSPSNIVAGYDDTVGAAADNPSFRPP
jgi:hypothetical protein